jgi:purine-binding chemotaxis protein CheW
MPQPEVSARAGREEGSGRLLVFSVAGQELAIPIEAIVEITSYRRPTPVPGAAPGVRGLLALRGRMVTVIDLRERLGLESEAGREPGRVIVLREGGELVGLAAESAARVIALGGGRAEALPGALRLRRPGLYQGALARPDGGYILMLDLPALLGDGR